MWSLWGRSLSLVVLLLAPPWLLAAGHGPLTLAWDAVTTAQGGGTLNNPIASYNLRWGLTSGQQSGGVNVTVGTACVASLCQLTVKGLNPSLQYFFIVTAVDTTGLESTLSNEATGRPGLVLHQ